MNNSTATTTGDATRSLRLSAYAVLIAIAAGQMIGDVLAINALDKIALEKSLVEREVAAQKKTLEAAGETFDADKLAEQALAKVRQQRPFLSANDRSRWCTVRSLVELGTYEIDAIQAEPGWDTIDMVQHRGADGELHLYSSKPPLMATLMAGPYWVIVKTTGATLGTHPFEIGRALVLLYNVVPLVIYFVLMARLAERWSQTDWGRLVMVATAVFGTFLTLYVVTINNHLHAAVCAAVLLSLTLSMWYDGRREWWRWVTAGLFGGLLAACELPALSFFAAVAVALAWLDWRRFAVAFVPAAAVVGAAALGTNYLAHGTFKPAYAMRSETNPEENWYVFEYERGGKMRQSYWSNPGGVDAGEPSVAKYAFHVLVGHHGVFSLTPMWLVTVIGLGMGLANRRTRAISFAIVAVSIVCMLFYIFRPKVIDRNYGGMTSGFRWVFWMAPLWLFGMLPALDWLCRKRMLRGFVVVLLALSCLSVAYPWQPWKQPWIADFLLHLGWIKF